MSNSSVMYRWQMKPVPNAEKIEELKSALKVEEHLAQMLIMRGIDTFDKAKAFFNPNLEQLHDPFLMKDMDKAAGRLALALDRNERILIYGDYDVDGTTAVSLMCTFLSNIEYHNYAYYIPDRYAEGYGVSYQGVQFAIDEGFDLMVVLDCGIKAIDKIAYAQDNDVDVIICDHHLPDERLPPALAVLDPKRSDCDYPFKELTGCGIGFKLLSALAQKIGIEDKEIYSLLDFVAVSTACDIVPVIGENRALLYQGIQQLERNPRLGFAELLGEKANEKSLTVTDLVFQIGPKINAAGRMEHGSEAVNLLTSNNAIEAKRLAEQITVHNQLRRDYDQGTTAEALEMIAENPLLMAAKSTVVFHPEWHKGVIGIVASRLIETHYKPTIVLTQSGDVAAGSARSVKGFDVHSAIEACSDLLEQFGGHKYAAGLTISLDKIEDFKSKFDEVVSATITDEMLIPTIEIDVELTFDQINRRFYNTLKRMAPFGPRNMKPTFVSHHVRDTGKSKVVGSDQTHLKVSLEQNGVELNGIAFGMADQIHFIQSGEPISVVYTIEENIWNGTSTLQLMVKDIQPTSDKLMQ